MFEFTPYIIPLIISAGIMAILGLYARRFHNQPAALSFAWVMLSAFIWSAGFIFEIMAVRLDTKIFWANVQFLGIALLPVAWLIMTLDYVGYTRHRRRIILVTLIIPTLTNILLWTNDLHHIWRGTSSLDTLSAPFSIVVYDYQFWFFFIHAPSGFVLFTISMVIALYALVYKPARYRQQIRLLLFSTALPILVDVMYILGFAPIPHFNVTPITFSVTGFLLAWNMFGFQFLDLMPIARDRVIENMRDLVIVLDAQNRVVDLNPVARATIPGDHPRVIGKSLTELFPDQRAVIAQFEHTDAAQTEIMLVVDGAPRWFDLTLSSIRQRAGRVVGRIVVLRDISEHKLMLEALQQSEQRFRAVAQSASDAIIVITHTGRVVSWNTAAEHMFGYTAAEIVGQDIAVIMPEASRAAHQRALHRAFITRQLASLNQTIEQTGLRKDGQTFPLELSLALWAVEGTLYISGIVRDISERKRAEVERDRLIADLDAYAHTVAHDLKNPLAVFIGFTEMLQESARAVLNAEQRDHLDIMTRTSDKMVEIVNELLLFASVREEQVDIAPLDMPAVLRAVQERLTLLITEYQAQISLPDHWPVALGYAPWIEEVWANYLSNAIKYGGTPPQIVLGATTQPNHMIQFWITDNGVGLTPEQQRALFREFARVEQTRTEGHGLGLSIVQRIIMRLDGHVGVTSRPGQGSTFTFTLPAVVPSLPPDGDQHRRGAESLRV